MIIRNSSEAKADLSVLVEAVSRGKQVLIDRAGVPVVRFAMRGGARSPDVLRGKIVVADDYWLNETASARTVAAAVGPDPRPPATADRLPRPSRPLQGGTSAPRQPPTGFQGPRGRSRAGPSLWLPPTEHPRK